jgi:EAL domain-containing protein (putative c-di-GMP-specific phosphodiesterase class I)
MINRSQHTMIFGFYTLFSIFLGIVCVAMSNSFFMGVGCFFIFLLTFVCIHLFLLGRETTSKITHILYDVEDNNNISQQEVKNIRDIITNVTDIIKNLMTDTENLQEQVANSQKKYDAQFNEFKMDFEKLALQKSQDFSSKKDTYDNADTPQKENSNNSLSEYLHYQTPINQHSTEKPFYSDKKHAFQDTHTSTMFSNIEEDFLNLDDDNGFSGLTRPNVDIRLKNIVTSHDIDDDEEFATIDQKIANTYRHLLDDTKDATFLETIDDYQTHDIRKQLQEKQNVMASNMSEHQTKIPTQDTVQSTNFEEDEFVDLTMNVPQKSNQTYIKNNSDEEFVTEIKTPDKKFNTHTIQEHLPSFVDLVPDEKLKHIAHRQATSNQPHNIPSLNSLLNSQSKDKPVPKSTEHLIVSTHTDNTPHNISQATIPTLSLPTLPIDFDKQNPEDSIKIIRSALESNNLDLFMRPITDNRIREVKFFEAYNYLHTHNSTYIPPDKFIPLARKNGMGIAVDRLMIVRSIQILRHITQSINDASIFCNISVSSIVDDAFGIELKDLLQEKSNVANHLIFEFPHQQLEQLDSMSIEKMQYFTNIGIRFSVDNIHGVLPDLLELAQIGISFIKLKPDDFSKGIYCNNIHLQGVNIKKSCQRAGILLCIAGINTHEDLLCAVENQADLLQGDLLGEKERSDRLEIYANA